MSSSVPPEKKPPKLLLREWAIISLFLGFLASLSLIHYGSSIHSKKLLILDHAIPHQIAISLKGAVKKEGIYYCRPGTSLKELLKEAGLANEASRGAIPFKKLLLNSCEIEIPSKSLRKTPEGGNRPSQKNSLEEK